MSLHMGKYKIEKRRVFYLTVQWLTYGSDAKLIPELSSQRFFTQLLASVIFNSI